MVIFASGPGRKNTHFIEINISSQTPEFVISVGNRSICAVNDEILKNVINIRRDSQYPLWPVNGEPSITFGTLELLFPISKKVRSCFISKMIVLVTFQKASLTKSLFILIKQYLFTCYCARTCFS